MAFGLELGWRRALVQGVPETVSVALAGAIAGGAVAVLAGLTLSSEQAQTNALIGRMTVPPSAARRGQIDTLIAGLKADGVWAKLDWLVVLAAHDAQAARLNWVASKSLSAVNAPAFTLDRGYAGDGVTAYLDFGEALTAAGNLFAVNSASIGVWVNQAGNNTSPTVIGAVSGPPYTAINMGSAAGSNLVFVNNATAVGSGTGGTGHRTAVRSAANSLAMFRDGAVANSGTAASTGIPPGNVGLLRFDVNYSPARVAAGYLGSALTDPEVAALHGRLSTYLTAIGAN